MVIRSTKQKPLNQAVTQLAWIVEPQPDIPIEHIIQLVLACHKDKKNVWRVYDVEADSRKYYSYLFVLSALAHRCLCNSKQQAPFPICIDHPIYGQMVRYLHNVKSQPKKYAALDKALRHNVRNIFDYSSEDDRKNIVLVGGRSPDDFKFAKAYKYPDDLFQGPFPKEIDISKIDLESAPITPKSLNRLVERICRSNLWKDWGHETKGRQRRRQTGPMQEDLWYLRRVEDVLQMYDDAIERDRAQWFRRTGPLAIDFDEGTFFYRRKKLAQLKSLVMNKRVAILEGYAATGKTVLALHLAYELCGTPKTKVYYFDCDKERDFDKSRLLSDIRSVKDVIIIENIHLAPDKFQQVYSAFKYDKKRYFLFTYRSPLQLHLDSKSEDLTKVSPLHLEPFEDADGLIDEFLHSHSESPLSPELRQQIKDVSSNSLWLLAYALIGYVETNGRGEPKSWILDSVTKDLQDLENFSVDYPEALIAIAALYRDDLLMAEKYLVNNLGFSTAILNDLARQGELVRQETSTGHILYGLPHTALAKAYWECGNKYKLRRNIPECEDLVYEYVSSGAPNGLCVLVQTEQEIRERVVARVEREGKLVNAISNEQSTGAIDSWLRRAHNASIAKDDILTILAHKIEEHECAVYIPEMLRNICLSGKEIWKRFCSKLDCEKLVNRMANTNGLVWAGLTIFENFKYSEPMMQKLYSNVNFEDIVQELNQTKDAWTIGRCVSAIYRVDPKAHAKLSQSLNWQNLADMLCDPGHLWSTGRCIEEIMYANPNAAKRLCGLMSPEELVKALDNCSEVLTSRGQVIATIYQANHAFGERLWRAYREKFGRHISRMKDPTSAVNSLRAVGLASPKMAREILGFLKRKKLANTLSGPEHLTEKVEFARWFLNLEKAAGRDFWKQYKHTLAASLSEPGAVCSIAPCLREISFGDKERPYELCSLLDIGRIADNLNNSVHFWSVVDDILSTVLQAHEAKGRKLGVLIDCEQAPQPAGRLFFDIWSGLSHVKDICSIDHDIAEKLCAHLDIRLLADQLSRSGDEYPKEIGEWINTMNALIPSHGRQLWRDLDKKRLAATLSSTDDVEALASCLEQIDTAQEQEGWVEELCTQLDIAHLAFSLKHAADDESGERLLAVISKCCPEIHKQLLRLLAQE